MVVIIEEIINTSLDIELKNAKFFIVALGREDLNLVNDLKINTKNTN